MEIFADRPSVPMGPPASSPAASLGFILSHPSFSPWISGPFMHKNRLQEFTQGSSMSPPVYQTFNEGLEHAPKFRSSVMVHGVTYISENTFLNIKAAEQDVAKNAMEYISKKIKDKGYLFFSKSILNEFVVKINLDVPTYTTLQLEGLDPILVSTLVFNGETYKGGTARSKKMSERLAACAVIQSLLANDRYKIVISEIIRAKAELLNASNNVKDSNIFSFDTTSAVAIYVPTSASLHPSSMAEHPCYGFRIPTSGKATDCIDLPLAFVSAIIEDALIVGENSSSKRWKKKKRDRVD